MAGEKKLLALTLDFAHRELYAAHVLIDLNLGLGTLVVLYFGGIESCIDL